VVRTALPAEVAMAVLVLDGMEPETPETRCRGIPASGSGDAKVS